MGIIRDLMGKVKHMADGGFTVRTNSGSEPAISSFGKSDMEAAQSLWRRVYMDKAPWLTKTVKSLNLAATIASEISRLITLEADSHVSEDKEINEVYQKEIMSELRNQVEFGLAFGGLIMKPYILNDSIRIDFAQPVDYQIIRTGTDGTIFEIRFKEYITHKESHYLRVEYHKYDEVTKSYHINNRVYKSDLKGNALNEIRDYSFIDVWAELLPEFELTEIERPLFGYFKPAVSNHINPKSHEGVSIFSRAIEAIRRADEGLSGLLREFRVKEAKQYVSELAVKNMDAQLPYLEEDYYIKLHTDEKPGETFFESYSPQIYTDDYLKALEEYKKEIEDAIGLARGTLSPIEQTAKTATEIMFSRQRTQVLIKENQKNLQNCLEAAVYAMSVWKNYPHAASELTVTTDWDDSVITDKAAEAASMLADVEMGLIKPELYVMKKYGLKTEEEARAMMPAADVLLDGVAVPREGEV